MSPQGRPPGDDPATGATVGARTVGGGVLAPGPNPRPNPLDARRFRSGGLRAPGSRGPKHACHPHGVPLVRRLVPRTPIHPPSVELGGLFLAARRRGHDHRHHHLFGHPGGSAGVHRRRIRVRRPGRRSAAGTESLTLISLTPARRPKVGPCPLPPPAPSDLLALAAFRGGGLERRAAGVGACAPAAPLHLAVSRSISPGSR